MQDREFCPRCLHLKDKVVQFLAQYVINSESVAVDRGHEAGNDLANILQRDHIALAAANFLDSSGQTFTGDRRGHTVPPDPLCALQMVRGRQRWCSTSTLKWSG